MYPDPKSMLISSEAERLLLRMQAILASEFGRQPLIIPNSVDCHRFTPGPRSRLPPTSTMACVPGGQVPTATRDPEPLYVVCTFLHRFTARHLRFRNLRFT